MPRVRVPSLKPLISRAGLKIKNQIMVTKTFQDVVSVPLDVRNGDQDQIQHIYRAFIRRVQEQQSNILWE